MKKELRNEILESIKNAIWSIDQFDENGYGADSAIIWWGSISQEISDFIFITLENQYNIGYEYFDRNGGFPKVDPDRMYRIDIIASPTQFDDDRKIVSMCRMKYYSA